MTLILKLPLGLSLALLGWTHAYGYLTALFVSAWGTLLFGGVQLSVLLWCAWRFWRHPASRRLSSALAATMLFLGAMQFVLYALWMWSPPDRDVCAEVVERGTVTLISPPHWPAELSQPYSLLYVPEKQGLWPHSRWLETARSLLE